MHILILHDGRQLGPLTEPAARDLVQAGAVKLDDLAWCHGLTDWQPLGEVLAAAAAESAPATDQARHPAEPASARQKAFLAYMGIAFAPTLDRDAAARLISEARENPREAERVARWAEERLKLHPELFEAEIQARKENRAQHFFEIAQAQGATLFEKLTKAHCQVLVGHLDVHAPGWDAEEKEAVWKHFFPAIGEKFPQLVTEEGRAKLKDAKSASRKTSASSRSARSGGAGATLGAIVRGIALGVLILAALWTVREFRPRAEAKPKPVTAGATLPTPAPEAASASTPAPAAAPPVAAAPSAPPTAATPEASLPMLAAEPAKPATEPPPATPEPRTTLFGELPMKTDAPAPATGAMELIPAPAARSSVIVTKPVPVILTYGKVTVPAGTTLPLVRRDGTRVAVRYLGQVIEIPATSTDLGTEAPPAQ